MSVKSVLKGCYANASNSAGRFRQLGDERWAAQCELQAEAVLRLLADLDNEQQEETSDGL